MEPQSSTRGLAIAGVVIATSSVAVTFAMILATPLAEDSMVWAFLGGAGIALGGLVVWAAQRGARSVDDLEHRGVRSTATVRRVEATQVRMGASPQVRLTLDVDGCESLSPEQVVTTLFLPVGISVVPGQRLWVIVDPDNRARVRVDWAAEPPARCSADEVAERLQTLDALRARGLVTESEYDARRARLLDSI